MVPFVPLQTPTEQFPSGQPLAFSQQMVQDQSIDCHSGGLYHIPGIKYTTAR